MITFEDKQNNSFKKKYVGVSQYVMHVCIYFSAYYLYPAYFQKGLEVGGFAGCGPDAVFHFWSLELHTSSCESCQCQLGAVALTP